MTSATVIGRYAIYDRIAAGGMATVHIGRLMGQVGFARTVAIKRLHAQFAMEPEFVAMFLDEARLAARIRHPNVVPTLDVVAMQGELFLVMEYVHGESLSRLLRLASARKQTMPQAHVASVMSGVLHGLHAAHQAKSDRGEPLGIVHRDISPQNVLVGIDGIARVLDFGVARAVGQIHTTREGQIKGKLAYMAPEQLQGSEVTARTDIFAAAIVLWEALVGERLFKGDTEGETVNLVLHSEIQPPSKRVTAISPALDAVVLRGLARDPKDRFGSAEEMAIALEEAVSPSLQRKVAEWVRDVAGEELSERTNLLTAIESGSDSTPQLPVETATELSQASGISVATETTEQPRRGSRSRFLYAVAAGGIATLGAVAFVTTRPHAPPPMVVATSEPIASTSSAPSASTAIPQTPEPSAAAASSVPKVTTRTASSSRLSTSATSAPTSSKPLWGW
jgi:serine/threonine protein kinase